MLNGGILNKMDGLMKFFKYWIFVGVILVLIGLFIVALGKYTFMGEDTTGVVGISFLITAVAAGPAILILKILCSLRGRTTLRRINGIERHL